MQDIYQGNKETERRKEDFCRCKGGKRKNKGVKREKCARVDTKLGIAKVSLSFFSFFKL